MKTRRARNVLLLLVACGIAGIGVTGYSFRREILESWWLPGLSSEEFAERVRAAEELGRVGSKRSVDALLSCLRAPSGKGLGDTAVIALERLFERVDSPLRVEIVEGLLDIQSLLEEQERWPPLELVPLGEEELEPEPEPEADRRIEPLGELESAIKRMGSREPLLYPILRRSLRGFNCGRPRIAAAILADAWPSSRSILEPFLSEAKPRNIAGFYHHAESSNRQSVARYFARTHRRPVARAVSLVHGALVWEVTPEGKQRRLDGDFLARRFQADPELLVRQAAVRLAGACGRVEGNLNLPALLATEMNPQLLQAIIEARSVWATTGGCEWFEASPGVVCRAYSRDNARMLPWREGELARLREILLSEEHPDVRDAASAAFARAMDGFLADSSSEEKPVKVAPELVLHEWGVWKDGCGSVFDPAMAIADLPPIVHRSTVSAAELWSNRSYSQNFVFKPVVFFQSHGPEIVTVRVDFHRGRPWVFYPEISDYVEKHVTIDYDETPGERSLIESEKKQGKKKPPWVKVPEEGNGLTSFSEPPNLPSGELGRRFNLVPWCLPLHDPTWADSGSGQQVVSSIGIEWCGLRIGYPETLEGPAASVPQESWWARLREIPSTPIALRNETERFLFYDGVVDLPTPVAAAWAGDDRQVLRIEVKSFDDYFPSVEELEYYLAPLPTEFLPAVAVIDVREEEARARVLRHVPGSAGPFLVSLAELPLEGAEVRASLLSILIEEGLTVEEAEALLDIWKTEFFETEGVRVLTVLPDWIYSRALPMEVRPVPEEIARTGIIWKECDDLQVHKVREPERHSKPSWCEASPIGIAEEDLELTSEPLRPMHEGSFNIGTDGEVIGVSVGKGSLRLSADGRWLALPFAEQERVGVQLLDLEQRRVIRAFQVSKAVNIHDYSLSGSGQRLAIAAQETGERMVQVVDIAHGVRLYVPTPEGRPTWTHLSSDGNRLAVLAGGRPIVAELASRRRLIPGLPTARRYRSPMLSADGRVLAILAQDEEASSFSWDLLLIDLEGGYHTVVAEDIDTPSIPTLSEDGTRIVYRGWDIEGAPQASVFVVDLRACHRSRIGTSLPREYDSLLPAVTLDGKTSVWIWWDVWATETHSGKNRRILRVGDDEAEWESVAISGDASRLACIVKHGSSGGTASRLLYVRRLDGNGSVAADSQPRHTMRRAYTAWWWRF